MTAAALFKSEKSDWPTPVKLYEHILENLLIDRPLDLDVCASPENTKCERYFTQEEDGLSKDWTGQRCWMNPPYGKDIGLWTEKAARKEATVVVGLLPARTDTRWWHRDVIAGSTAVYFLKGRIKFDGAENGAPFPSAVVVWERKYYPYPTPLYGSFNAS